MRVLLKLELDCTPEAVWDAVRSPQTLRDVSFPLTTLASLEDGGFPEQWPEGRHLVSVRALGLTDIGRQCIEISYPQRADGVRVARDTGRGVSGPLSLVTRWRHEMAVSALPDGRTLYRDQLRFSAGLLTPLLWPIYWAYWQWRGFGLRRLASTW